MLGARVRQPAHVLQAPGERVALELELLEAQQARSACALLADERRGGRDVRERRRDEL